VISSNLGYSKEKRVKVEERTNVMCLTFPWVPVPISTVSCMGYNFAEYKVPIVVLNKHCISFTQFLVDIELRV
jgi:hypothetical protein